MKISKRFFCCYSGLSRSELAEILRVRRSTVTMFDSKGLVPWSKLKYLSDSQGVSWDWIIEGYEPKKSRKEAKTPRSTTPKFNRVGINRRYLSLFPKMNLTQIAEIVGVTPNVVSGWKLNKRMVPWERLQSAVDMFGVRWDWLVDGIQPKLREWTP